MALEILRVPNFEYSGMYFPDIAARIRRYSRVYAPEITNEDRRELAIQLERAFALMAHYNNVLLDMVANEMFLETARLPESVKLMLQLINYRMLPASPAVVDMLGTLSRDYTTTTRLLELNRKFTTKRSAGVPEIIYENTAALDTTARTDQITDAYALAQTDTGTCNTSSSDSDIITRVTGPNWTTATIGNYIQVSGSILGNNTEDLRIIELLDETGPGTGIYNKVRLSGASFVTESGVTWTLRELSLNDATALNAGIGAGVFAAAPEENDKFYFGHSDVMWDRFDVVLSSGTPSIAAVWEFFDDSDTTFTPDSVTVDPVGAPGTLRFDLTAFLGPEEVTGALVQVTHVETGATTNAFSSWVGSVNILNIDGYLGQTTPSTTATDYLVSSDWRVLDVVTDTTKPTGVPWEQSGYTSFNLPQSQEDAWDKYTLYDKTTAEFREGYFLRYRVVDNAGAAAAPVASRLSFNSGEKYVLVEVVQGKTVEDRPIGSSDGSPNQQFILNNSPYIYQSIRVFVDEGGGDIEWSEVNTFLTSYSISRNFYVDIQTDGTAILKFGDGVNGRIPPAGVNNIRAIYRVGGNEDGNIGASRLTVNRDGVGVFKTITNPRVGRYWVEADWNSSDALERVKQAGPLNLNTMRRAITGPDIEVLSRSFKNADGVRPVARAKAYEESYGPKTIELVVCGGNGAALSSAYKEELGEYFNGGSRYGGVLLANHQVVVNNYQPKQIGYTIEVQANSIVTEQLILQVLSALVSPTAVERNRTTYVWNFGQEVPNSRISSEIFSIAPGNVFKVTITSPASDVALAQRELPVLDAVNTHIVIVPPNF